MEARPLIELVVMQKDEAGNIAKTFESVKPYVDRFTVFDTGSVDGSDKIAIEAMEGVVGDLHHGAFTDYAESRNKALDLAGERAVFTLFLGGDETLHGGEALRAFLEEKRDASDGAYCVEMVSGNRSFPYTRVLRTDARWRYVGKVHERPVGPKGETRGPLIPGVRIVHAPSDPHRKVKRLREYDLPVLTKTVEDGLYSLEERAHAMYFLAETHAALASEAIRDAGGRTPGGAHLSHQYAAMALYLRYAQIADQPDREAYDPRKVHLALLMYYHVAESAGFYTSGELVERVQKLVNAAPKLPEARYLLAKHMVDIDAKKALHLALDASRVAREHRQNPIYDATDTRLEWVSLQIAAYCAKTNRNLQRAKEIAERAVAAGGPRDKFAEYLR